MMIITPLFLILLLNSLCQAAVLDNKTTRLFKILDEIKEKGETGKKLDYVAEKDDAPVAQRENTGSFLDFPKDLIYFFVTFMGYSDVLNWSVASKYTRSIMGKACYATQLDEKKKFRDPFLNILVRNKTEYKRHFMPDILSVYIAHYVYCCFENHGQKVIISERRSPLGALFYDKMIRDGIKLDPGLFRTFADDAGYEDIRKIIIDQSDAENFVVKILEFCLKKDYFGFINLILSKAKSFNKPLNACLRTAISHDIIAAISKLLKYGPKFYGNLDECLRIAIVYNNPRALTELRAVAGEFSLTARGRHEALRLLEVLNCSDEVKNLARQILARITLI